MKCVVCKQGETAAKGTTLSLTKGQTSLTVTDVPADVCTACGEQYISEEVGRKVAALRDVMAELGQSRNEKRSYSELEETLEARRLNHDRELFRQKRVEENDRDAEPVIADLRRAGISVSSISRLRLDETNHSIVVPLLLDWLRRMRNVDIKTAIVGVLGSKWAQPMATLPLLGEFHSAGFEKKHEQLKWFIGVALEVLADDDVFDELAAIIKEPAHGFTRGMFVLALGRMKHERDRAVSLLLTVLQEDEFQWSAIIALRKLGAVESRALVEPFLAHPDIELQKVARVAIAKFDRLAAGKSR